MKTEREKFKDWHFLDWKLNNAVTDTVEFARELYERVYSHDHTSSIRDVEFKAWQAAKAQAVPELTDKMIVAIESEVESQLKASAIDADPFRLDGEKIWYAAVEAQEPAK